MFNDSFTPRTGALFEIFSAVRIKEAFSPPIRGILWKTDSLLFEGVSLLLLLLLSETEKTVGAFASARGSN